MPFQWSIGVSLFLLLTVGVAQPPVQGQTETKTKTETDTKNLLVFYAMGDVPYKATEDEILQAQIARLPEDGSFVIHVGDIKEGAPPCDENIYRKVAGFLSKCQSPVFILPGDNEWNDCTNPIQGWQFWNSYFMRFEQRWQHKLPVYRQLEREENFSMVLGNVLVIGVNVVGGLVHDPDEWKVRHEQNLDWMRRNLDQFEKQISSMVIFGHATPTDKHKDFFGTLCEIAQQFGKPILYLHGDGHKWIHDRPFTAKNILRVQVDQGGIAPPIKVTVTDHASEPFVFDRRQ